MNGLKAFWLRLHQCRPGYFIRTASEGGGLEIHLTDGSIIPESEASPILTKPYYEQARKLENLINAKDSPYAELALMESQNRKEVNPNASTAGR